jgi:taurine--2-oxoglutarate transaminase
MTPYLYRSPFFAQTEDEECARALEHFEQVVRFEGPDTIAAVLLESIPGTAGVMVPPKDYFKGIREITRKYGILMITDEVMAGFGRTGEWFALDAFDYVPDLISFAKGCNSGYVPAGGVIFSDEIAHSFDERVFPGGLTYSGHPLAMASIVAAQEAMEAEDIVGNAHRVGEDVISAGLNDLKGKHEHIGDVRGKGVMWVAEMVANRTSKDMLDGETMSAIHSKAMDAGLLVDVHDNRIHVVPPCVITPEEAKRGIDILDGVLSELGL